MAWSWSHTAEAYANAQKNLESQVRAWLEVVFAEWHAAEDLDSVSPEFNESKYNVALADAKELPCDALADFIWQQMSEQATCDNGGFDAWCCPYGCGCHTVSFDAA